jgi:serine/threonine protein kinase
MTIAGMGTLQALHTLDGYTLERRIGAGGFGEVWLATATALGHQVALKSVVAPSSVKRELAAVQQFKHLALKHPGLISIEHVGLLPEGGFFYVMPIADGSPGLDIGDPDWCPLTLAARLAYCRKSDAGWFTAQQVRECLGVIAHAAGFLEEAGLVHRDIKPDNILFVRGQPVLSDVSLLAEDRLQLTEIGTPGYRAPSWFTETGGNPDAYGIAATLFTTLTGHAPDKMGRAAYRWPPGGEGALSADERAEWLRLHRVILRATHEKASERFRTLHELANAIEGGASGAEASGAKSHERMRRSRLLIVSGVFLAAAAFIGRSTAPRPDPSAASPTSPAEPTSFDNPWGEFDRLLAQATKETEAIESEWMALAESTRSQLLALRDAKQLVDVEGIVDQLAINFAGLDDIEFDLLDALRNRWVEEQLPAAWRMGLEEDKDADGWKAAQRRKQQLADLDGMFTRLKKEDILLSVSWKVVAVRYLKALEAMSEEPPFQERVLAMLEKVSPEHKIEKRKRDWARNREAAETAASPASTISVDGSKTDELGGDARLPARRFGLSER